MNIRPPVDNNALERPATGRSSQRPPIQRAWHYQELARQHRDEETFWLCRASYFGRLSLRP
jgi:hypothetical protein